MVSSPVSNTAADTGIDFTRRNVTPQTSLRASSHSALKRNTHVSNMFTKFLFNSKEMGLAIAIHTSNPSTLGGCSSRIQVEGQHRQLSEIWPQQQINTKKAVYTALVQCLDFPALHKKGLGTAHNLLWAKPTYVCPDSMNRFHNRSFVPKYKKYYTVHEYQCAH